MSGLNEYDGYGSDETSRRPLWGRPGPTNDAATASVVIGVIGCLMFFVCVSPFVFGPTAVVLGGLGLSRASSYGVGRYTAVAGVALGVGAVVLGLMARGRE